MICTGRTVAALREGDRSWPPRVKGKTSHREALTEKRFHALCLPLVVVAEQIDVRSCNTVARPCKNEWKSLKSNNNNNKRAGV